MSDRAPGPAIDAAAIGATDGTVPWRALMAETRAALAAGGILSAEVEARRIVEEATGCDGAALHAHLDEPATVRGVAAIDRMVERRLAGEPLQYVLGRWAFRGLDLMVDFRVLIPRPETEGLVDHALAELDRLAARPGPCPVVVDLGSGSGAIGLAVVDERPGTELHAVDCEPGAVQVTRANLAGLGVAGSSVLVHEGSWYTALPPRLAGRVAVVVSNPPYVAHDDDLPVEVAKWEPAAALMAGPTGLEAIEVVVAEAPCWLVPGGAVVVEIGEAQGAAARALAVRAGFAEVEVRPDLAGRDRVLVARGHAARVNDRVEGNGARFEVDAVLVDRLAAALERGDVVLFPTDTVYGIAALPSVPGATDKLYALKGRGPDTPLAVLVSDADAGHAVVADVPAPVDRIMRTLWPGPLTIVMERDPAYAHWELGGDPSTIGVRCPDHDLVRALAARVGPVATTSANRHGEPTPVDSASAVSSLDGRVAIVVDGGPLTATASTVVDATRSQWHILRGGPLSLAKIEAASRP